MRLSLNRRARIRPLALVAPLAAVALVAGCSAGPFSGPTVNDTPAVDAPIVETPAVEAPAADDSAAEAAGASTATLLMDGQSFTFSPTICMSGDEDVLVSGPGVDDGSQEPAFLDVDFYRVDLFWGGGVRVNLGTDQPMTSSDRFYSITVGASDDYMVEQVENDDDAELMVEGIVRDNGEAELGVGTLTVSCG